MSALLLAGASAAFAQTTVTAAWDRNTDPYTAGYRLYYGTQPGNYPWSVDAGNQTSAPLSLTPGSTYYFTVRAYSSSYEYGPPSAEVSFNLAPTAPTAQITATLQGGNTAVVNWQTTNAASARINGQSVALSGSTSVAISGTTTFTLVATAASGATATASATVDASTPSAPGAPTNVASRVSGSQATVSWRPPSTGGAPSSYLLYVGTSPGGSDLANAYNVGNVQSVTASLPRGTFYARVRAVNAAGTGPFSIETRFNVGGRRLRRPSSLRVTWQGTAAAFEWTAPVPDGNEPIEDRIAGYVVEAGTSPGATDIATLPVGNVTAFRAEVPPGTYYVRVRAVNDYGESDASDEIIVQGVGGPQQPTGLSSSGTGSTVDLRWTAPRQGPPPTGYVIEAGSAPGLANLAVLQVADVTTFSTVAPPGVYYVRVRAVNARGQSAPSNEIVVRR